MSPEDHDLLIRIHEQLQRLQTDQSAIRVEMQADKKVADQRFKDLERFFTLARNGFAFLVAIGAILQFALLLYERTIKVFLTKQ